MKRKTPVLAALLVATVLLSTGFALRPRHPHDIPWLHHNPPLTPNDDHPLSPTELKPTVEAWAAGQGFTVKTTGTTMIEVFDNWGDPFLTIQEGQTGIEDEKGHFKLIHRFSTVSLFPPKTLIQRIREKLLP